MVKNWMDPAVITETSRFFGSFTLVLTGVAIWDVLSTLWFEWQVITGKRKFKWPMVIYEVARVALLLHIFAVTINRNALHEVPCTQLTFMSKFCDALGTCMSSLILVLRTRAVWHRDIKVTCLLGLLFIGQIVAWSQTFRYSKARWNPTRNLCDVLSTGPRSLMVTVWAYTMIFDLIILVLCSYRLASHRSSTLGNLLLRDGVSYFCFAFAANLVQTVMAGLQLNPVMNIMTLPFAVVVSVIAATTVFRNVFTASDNFYGESSGSSDGLHSVNDGPLRTGAHILFYHDTSTQVTTNEIPLERFKTTHDISTVSVQKVVDVDVDQGTVNGTRDQSAEYRMQRNHGRLFNDSDQLLSR